MLSLVSLVRFGCFSTFFASLEPQEFNSDIDWCNGTRQCALGPILRPEILTLLSEVQSLSVLPFFASTEPQESDSDIDSHNGTRQCALGPILRPEIQISSPPKKLPEIEIIKRLKPSEISIFGNFIFFPETQPKNPGDHS